MKKSSALIFVSMLLLIIPLLFAQPIFKQDTNVQLNLPCTVNGVLCSNAATCTATIINPDNIVLINNQSMIQNNAVFSINLTSNQTFTLGEYNFNVNCCDGSLCASKFLIFHINLTGIQNDVNETYFFIFIGVTILILISLLLYKMSNTEDYGWAVGYLSGSYLLLIAFLFVIYQIAVYYIYTVTIITSFLYFFWHLSMILFLPYLLGVGLYLLGKLTTEKDVKKYVDMGYTSEEAKNMSKRRR